MKSITVAVVDDFQLYREGVSAVLSNLGYSIVLNAENGQDLLDKMATYPQKPDVCLIDISMPVMNGFIATREMKKRWPEVKIIGLSLHDEETVISKLKNCGADAFLSKGEKIVIIDSTIKALFVDKVIVTV